jgi:hypothetical protein
LGFRSEKSNAAEGLDVTLIIVSFTRRECLEARELRGLDKGRYVGLDLIAPVANG